MNTVNMQLYYIQNCLTQECWTANAGEALIYAHDDLVPYYNVYRQGGNCYSLLPAEILFDVQRRKVILNSM